MLLICISGFLAYNQAVVALLSKGQDDVEGECNVHNDPEQTNDEKSYKRTRVSGKGLSFAYVVWKTVELV